MSRRWQPVGLPQHTFIEETIVDLAQAVTNLDDVIALVTNAFSRKLSSEPLLRRAAAERKKLRWRWELEEIISMAAGGRTRCLSTGMTGMSSGPMGCPSRLGRLVLQQNFVTFCP